MKQEERKNRFMVTKRQLLADLIVLMGGREAELLIFNDLSSGSEMIFIEQITWLQMRFAMGNVWLLEFRLFPIEKCLQMH